MPIHSPLGDFDQGDLEPQVMSVKVTNRNDFLIRDMFDGVPYEFHPNKPLAVPIDAANHIFGWWPPYTDDEGKQHSVDPAAMKAHVIKRFGWNTPAMQTSGSAELFYNRLVITPMIYRMVPVEVQPEDQAVEPAPRAPKSNKLMAAAAEAAARA